MEAEFCESAYPISEETSLKPKLMVEIGGRPITQRTRGQGDGEINTHV